MHRTLCLSMLALSAAAPIAYADSFRYTFSFTHLESYVSDGGASNLPDFRLTLDFAQLIQTTGLATLSKPRSTPFGYTISEFGENNEGDFLFTNPGGSLTDDSIGFTPQSFVFIPLDPNNSAYDVVGTYTGLLENNTDPALFGDASLTISHVTPEPSSLLLLTSGVLCAGYAMRRRRTGSAFLY